MSEEQYENYPYPVYVTEEELWAEWRLPAFGFSSPRTREYMHRLSNTNLLGGDYFGFFRPEPKWDKPMYPDPVTPATDPIPSPCYAPCSGTDLPPAPEVLLPIVVGIYSGLGGLG